MSGGSTPKVSACAERDVEIRTSELLRAIAAEPVPPKIAALAMKLQDALAVRVAALDSMGEAAGSGDAEQGVTSS